MQKYYSVILLWCLFLPLLNRLGFTQDRSINRFIFDQRNEQTACKTVKRPVYRFSDRSGCGAHFQKTTEFETNGAGFAVSHVFGFGLLDAYALVSIAKSWRTVPAQKICAIQSIPIQRTAYNQPNNKCRLNMPRNFK